MTAGSREDSSRPCSSMALLSSRLETCPVQRWLQKPSVTTSDTSSLEPQRGNLCPLRVISYGNFYSILGDLLYSLSVIIKNKTCKVVESLPINDFSDERRWILLQGNGQKEKKLHLNCFPLHDQTIILMSLSAPKQKTLKVVFDSSIK